MPLPKLNTTLHTLKLPSTGKEIQFRPFLVKEEKILMMAMESGETNDMINSLRQIIDSCVEEELNVSELPMFDIEYIFLQLRARSVGEEIELNYNLENDPCDKLMNANCSYYVKLKVDEIQVERDKNHKDLIDITDKIKVKVKYPKIEESSRIAGLQGKELVDKTFEMVGNSIEYIMDGEEMHQTKDYTQAERDEFVQSLSSGQFREIQNFFNTMPKLSKKVVGECQSCGKKNERVLEGMASFFV